MHVGLSYDVYLDGFTYVGRGKCNVPGADQCYLVVGLYGPTTHTREAMHVHRLSDLFRTG